MRESVFIVQHIEGILRGQRAKGPNEELDVHGGERAGTLLLAGHLCAAFAYQRRVLRTGFALHAGTTFAWQCAIIEAELALQGLARLEIVRVMSIMNACETTMRATWAGESRDLVTEVAHGIVVGLERMYAFDIVYRLQKLTIVPELFITPVRARLAESCLAFHAPSVGPRVLVQAGIL